MPPSPKLPAIRRRDLVTGRTPWPPVDPRLSPSPSFRTLRTEVAVIGAGVSGALMAEALSRRFEVTVLDRRGPALGSISASTALIQWEIDLPMTAIARRLGEDAARRAYLRAFRAVQALADLAEGLEIDCGWASRRSLYLTGDAFGRRALRAEAEARAAAGLPSAFLTGPELRARFGVDRTGAVLSQGAAAVDPVRLTAGLLRAARRRGAAFHWPVEIISLRSGREGVRLDTADGRRIEARHVVFCTGYEFPEGLETPGGRIVSTWALATAPHQRRLPDWMEDTLLWEASDPYLYARTDAGGRLILGGEDEASATAHADRRRLAGKGRSLAAGFAALTSAPPPEPARMWAGAFGESVSGLPRISPFPGHPDVWAAIGFGGNGITWAMIARQIIDAALAGDGDPDAELFLRG